MTKPDFVKYFQQGIDHFNSREFWEAHESWETIWLSAESDCEQFLQGLIQLAAAYHHLQRGTTRGAPRLIAAGLGRLAPFPRNYCGIDRSAVETAARRHAETLSVDEYPKIIVADTAAIAPPSLQW